MTQSIPTTAADFETILAAQASAGDTELTLASVEDTDGNNLAAGLYGFTLSGDEENYKEFIVGVLSGTSVTSVRSISAQGVSTVGLSKYHRRGASVAITDWVVIGRLVGVASGTTGFDSAAPLFYDADPGNFTGNEIPTADWVSALVNGGTVSFNPQILTTQVAGENLTANQAVYFKESDQRWYKIDADSTSTYQMLKRGFANATQTTGGTLGILVTGLMSGFSGLTPGSKYYASNTAGDISTTPGTNTIYVGTAFSATQLIVDPYVRDIPYGNEKDALAGSLGTPSSSNLYLTQLNTSDGQADQSQTAQDATQGVGLANTTGLNNKLAQSFIPTTTKIRGVSLFKTTNTGTFTGTVTVALQADSAGSPSGSNLASVTITNAQWLALVNGEFDAIFSTEYTSMTVGSLYWIVISTSTSDTANHPNVRSNSIGGYANGSVKYNNTADGWVAIATIDLYFKTLEGNTSQVITSGADGYIGASLVPQMIDSNTTAITITNGASSTETTLYTKTLPANLLGRNNVVRGKVYLSSFGRSNTNNPVFRLKYGATTVATITLGTGTGISPACSGFLYFELINANSTISQIGTLEFIASIGGAEATADTNVGFSKALQFANGTAAEDSTGALEVSVTVDYANTNADDDLVTLYGYMEVIRQL